MPPSQAFCRQCEETHSRPVGRNCKRRRAQVSDAADMFVNISGPSQSLASAAPTNPTSDVSALLLSKLTAIQGQLDSMDVRIRNNETALSDRTTERAASALVNSTPGPSVANNLEPITDTVVPSTDF